MKVHSLSKPCILYLASSRVSYQRHCAVHDRSSSKDLISSLKSVTPAQQSLMVDALGSQGFNLQQF